jgi:F-type H+-transporting ATPase subunit b
MDILEGILKSLNIDPVVMLWNGILFLVTLAILNVVFWQPILRHLEQRKDHIADAYKTVDDTRREMEDLRGEYQTRLARIEADARGQIQQTVREAQSQREAMIAQARAQAEQISQQGVQNIAREKEETLANMRETLDDVALEALTKATGLSTDPVQRKLVDEYIAQNVLRS